MKNSREERRCELCEAAMDIADERHVLCEKKGVVKREHVCRKFSLDLLKLDPTPVKLPGFEESVDFKDILS